MTQDVKDLPIPVPQIVYMKCSECGELRLILFIRPDRGELLCGACFAAYMANTVGAVKKEGGA